MKLISIILGIVILFPLTCMAEDIIIPWNVVSRIAQTYRPIQPDPILITAHVEYGSGGDKAVYFDLDYYDTDSGKIVSKGTCDPTRYVAPDYSSEVMTVNGQAIKVFVWCKKYSDTGTNFYQATPQTKQGLAFVVNALSASSTTVNLELIGIPFRLSAEGFTAVWNKSSDKAL